MMNADEYFQRYLQKRTADEELRYKMRRKLVLFRRPRVTRSPAGGLHTPFNCAEVGALLALAGLCCIIVFSIVGYICFTVTLLVLIPRWAAAIAYATPFALCVAAYAAILRHSAWFFRLRPVLRWAASVASAMILTCLLIGTLGFLVRFLI
jgi:hypothetical protein